MDADGRIIPLVEDDQGEGVKDLVDQLEATEVKAKAFDEFMEGLREPWRKK